MTISLQRQYDEKKFQFAIGLGDVAAIDTSEDSGFFPTGVDLVFRNYHDEDGWEVQARVAGPNRKRDGKPGVRHDDKLFTGPAATGFHRYSDDDFPGLTGYAAFHNAPQWLHDLAREHSPVQPGPVVPPGWTDEVTPRDWQPGDRVLVRPNPSNSDASYWRTAPAGVLGRVLDSVDSEGDVYIEVDEPFTDTTTRRVARQVETAWVRPGDLELHL